MSVRSILAFEAELATALAVLVARGITLARIRLG
jgi:hypothetical protein